MNWVGYGREEVSLYTLEVFQILYQKERIVIKMKDKYAIKYNQSRFFYNSGNLIDA